MKMRILVVVWLLLAVPAAAGAVEIRNFRSGLACTGAATTQGDGWVCHDTQEVFVTDQGQCVYAGDTVPCTWIGFEFDYAGAGLDTRLQCTAETSEPTTSGNPGKEVARHRVSEDFELPLEGDSGHFFNPMYWIFETRPGTHDITARYACRSGDATVFTATFHLHFPQARTAGTKEGQGRPN
jgi:hypothetical protein